MADGGRKEWRIRYRFLVQETEFMGYHSWKEKSLGKLKFKEGVSVSQDFHFEEYMSSAVSGRSLCP